MTTSLGITGSVPNARAENRRAAAEPLCDLCRGSDPAEARAYLKQWCTSAKRCRIPAFANLVRWIEKHFDAIITAVDSACPTASLSEPYSGQTLQDTAYPSVEGC